MAAPIHLADAGIPAGRVAGRPRSHLLPDGLLKTLGRTGDPTLSTMPPFQNPFQMWVDAWGKMAPRRLRRRRDAGAFPASLPFATMPFAPWCVSGQPWVDAWMKAFSQPLSVSHGRKPLDALSALRLLWVDLPWKWLAACRNSRPSGCRTRCAF